MIKLIASLPPKTSINPVRNLVEMLVFDVFLFIFIYLFISISL